MASLPYLPTVQAVHPSQYQSFTTEELRRHFLVESSDDIAADLNLIYTHYDRLIAGLIRPLDTTLSLNNYENLRSEFFLQRREIGIINVGGVGIITADGVQYSLEKYDCLYIGLGVREVSFTGNGAIFYVLSSPAHRACATRLMKAAEASPVAMGATATSNERTIYKYIHLDGIESCQLVMGLTTLKQGSVWNTMPSHIHDRRSEVYFYFDLPEDQRVMHFMGEPNRTRNIVVKNLDIVLSPAWSIHSGCGTSNYSFVWGMAGENKDYTDMDPYPAAMLF
jgi:4-deoxy-L-threo-5-hexosulose-uronate ketol-isomerase